MAIRPLKKLEIFAWGERVPEVIDYVSNIRDFHIEAIEDLQDSPSHLKDIARQRLQEIGSYLSIWRETEEFVSLHGGSVFKKSFFAPRKTLSLEKAARTWDNKGKVMFDELAKMLNSVKEIEKGIQRVRDEIEFVRPWSFLTIPFVTFASLKYLKWMAFVVPDRYVSQFWKDLEEIDGNYWLWSRKEGKEWYLVLVYFNSEVITKLDLWKEYSVSFPSTDMLPSAYLTDLEKKLSDLQDQKAKQEEELKRWLADQAETYKILVDYLSVEQSKWQVIADNVVKGKNFVYLWGWIDKDKLDRLKYHLEQNYPVRLIASDPSEADDPPVKIHNPAWLRPFEVITKLYGVPHYRFFDPTKFIAPAFFIFFGIALGDAGYGFLLLLTALYLLLRYRDAEESTKSTLLFIFYLGLTSTIFGTITWTWFGENPFVVNGKVFGFFSFFDVVHNTNLGLGTVLIIGIIMQMYAMFIKAWWALKHSDWQTAVFDVFTWQIFLLSLVVLVLPIIGISVSATTLLYAKYIAITASLILVLTQGRHVKSPVGKILIGLISLYGIAGGYGIASFLADTLSYSRLLALNLSTGIVAHVLNGMLVPMIKILIGLLLLPLAHALNLALGLLGSFVHSSRLIFLEMYGRFFEETGREFKPLTLDGKYYKFVKEVDAK